MLNPQQLAPQPTDPQQVQAAFLTSLKENGIPPCPAVLVEVGNEMRKEEPDTRRLATLISSDVGIASGVLKTANSPYFGLRRRVSSVMEAVQVLGLETTSQAVACVALHEAFPNVRGMDSFWETSAKIAQLSGALAQQRRWHGVRSQDAYTFGLFRDCGIAVLLQRFGDRYVEVLNRASATSDLAFTEIEDQTMPANHAIVGGMLTQSWWLPEGINSAVRNHHDISALDELGAARLGMQRASRTLVAIAQTSEYILQLKTGRRTTGEWDRLGAACLHQLGLAEDDLGPLMAEMDDALSS